MAKGSRSESIVHVTSKGQATIPARMRARFGIPAPGRVRFVEEGGRLVVRPVRDVDDMMGSLKHRIPDGVSLAGELRQERQRDEAREKGRRPRRRRS